MGIEVNRNKIIYKRNFKASPEEIYRAYTNKDLFEQWFHPKGGTTKVYRYEVQEGGEGFFSIETPQGKSYTLTRYKEIHRPTFLAYEDYFADERGKINKEVPGMYNTVRLNDIGQGVTELVATSELSSAEMVQQMIDMELEAGMDSTFDNLEELLQKS
ncbi:SRPBCC domain-containing protein [Staphylococcus sp. SQ8-PEA]|uniref:SRPBCC domain-containing protein n=1 Tax=Staphylococcus marylandisciuri TaxID=2981529 RepID=A0ABT2QMS6_9STAP|nr:SRPBCC domain-containing protein [Staphylococcus marylandisciuri]MCU5745288.1 SRPBCC domain-containing protein [Staphylococcus marylandisciuri]